MFKKAEHWDGPIYFIEMWDVSLLAPQEYLPWDAKFVVKYSGRNLQANLCRYSLFSWASLRLAAHFLTKPCTFLMSSSFRGDIEQHWPILILIFTMRPDKTMRTLILIISHKLNEKEAKTITCNYSLYWEDIKIGKRKSQLWVWVSCNLWIRTKALTFTTDKQTYYRDQKSSLNEWLPSNYTRPKFIGSHPISDIISLENFTFQLLDSQRIIRNKSCLSLRD